MKKRILIVCILVVSILVTMSIVTAVSNIKTGEKKESPLYRVRIGNWINKESQSENRIIANIFLKFFQNRMFFTPFKLALNRIADNSFGTYGQPPTPCTPKCQM